MAGYLITSPYTESEIASSGPAMGRGFCCLALPTEHPDDVRAKSERLHAKIISGCYLMNIDMVRLNQKRDNIDKENALITRKIGTFIGYAGAKQLLKQAMSQANCVEFSCSS